MTRMNLSLDVLCEDPANWKRQLCLGELKPATRWMDAITKFINTPWVSLKAQSQDWNF